MKKTMVMTGVALMAACAAPAACVWSGRSVT